MEAVEDDPEAEHGNLVEEFSRINLDNHSFIQTETSQVGRQNNFGIYTVGPIKLWNRKTRFKQSSAYLMQNLKQLVLVESKTEGCVKFKFQLKSYEKKNEFIDEGIRNHFQIIKVGFMNKHTLRHFAENHDRLIENVARLQGFPGVKYLTYKI